MALGAGEVAQLLRVAFGEPEVGTCLAFDRGFAGAAQQRVLERPRRPRQPAVGGAELGAKQGHLDGVLRAGLGQGRLRHLQGPRRSAVAAQRARHGKTLDCRQAAVAVFFKARRQCAHQRHKRQDVLRVVLQHLQHAPRLAAAQVGKISLRNQRARQVVGARKTEHRLLHGREPVVRCFGKQPAADVNQIEVLLRFWQPDTGKHRARLQQGPVVALAVVAYERGSGGHVRRKQLQHTPLGAQARQKVLLEHHLVAAKVSEPKQKRHRPGPALQAGGLGVYKQQLARAQRTGQSSAAGRQRPQGVAGKHVGGGKGAPANPLLQRVRFRASPDRARPHRHLDQVAEGRQRAAAWRRRGSAAPSVGGRGRGRGRGREVGPRLYARRRTFAEFRAGARQRPRTAEAAQLGPKSHAGTPSAAALDMASAT